MGKQKIYNFTQKQATRRKRWLVVLFVCAALVWIALIGCAVYFGNLLGLINRADKEPVETMSQAEYQQLMDQLRETIPENENVAEMKPEDVNWENTQGLLESNEQIINILLIGQDTRTREVRSLTDTLILVTVNKPAGKITFTSFMRDMYVQIPGYRDNRINVAYVLGGTELLNECMNTNFGVSVDGNIIVDFYGFIDVVNMMGGLDLELTADEADYMNENFSWDVDDGEDDDWNLQAGVNHLTGSQVLSYARMRNVGYGDYQRTERQRLVLTKLVEKAKSLSVSELNLLLQHALPMITTDMEETQLLSYALELFPQLSKLDVNTLRIPAEGTYKSVYIDGMAVLLPDLPANRLLLEEIMRIPEK